MEELIVISGKGGTGKTSLTASFAVLAERAVIADCDVDAADLHLLLHPHHVGIVIFFCTMCRVVVPGEFCLFYPIQSKYRNRYCAF